MIADKIPLVALKVYRERFSTDTHAKFFRNRALASGYGMEDYPVYSSLQATDEEQHEQNSFFIREMDMLNGEK